jgi:hypothetical protein
MRIWFALLVVPLLALTDQSVAFALVGWECEHQSTVLLHASHAFFLAVAIGGAVVAGRRWHETRATRANGARQRRFLAGVATTIAALSALAIAAMWIPTWLISSCIA